MRAVTLFVVLAGFVGLVGYLLARSARATSVSGAPLLAALEVPDTEAARALLDRWVDRSRRWRGAAVVPAVALAAAVGLGMRGEIAVTSLLDTAGVAPIWSDALVMGLLGAALGAFGAELHHLRRMPIGPRAAGLRPRDVTVLRRPLARSRRGFVVVLGVAAVVLHALVVAGDRAHGLPWAALVSLLLVAASEAVERRIVLRPRPALSGDLERADDAVRRLAVRSVDDAASGAAVLLTGWSAIGSLGVMPDSAPVDPLLVVWAVGALCCAVWWAWRSRPQTLVAEVTGRSPVST